MWEELPATLPGLSDGEAALLTHLFSVHHHRPLLRAPGGKSTMALLVSNK